ncbi:hypothetical protein CYMTET_28500 [Cymbomonas tetramitiformis]|uniref:Uncharacterized protein n=1 Tax=Cymbomonas tetramitiformis TaxID=36881 RepID=A0AAE0KW59_9CHLO|nr:hypothetical protein CYMTET_28500 [Cymbomonas tetramitiformis]
MKMDDLMKWYRGEDQYAAYVLISPWTSASYVAGDKISTRLRELTTRLKHNVAKVLFEKVWELSRDRWANWVVKGLIRRPATCPVLYKFTLEQLVRVFEAIRSYFNWQQRASLRAKVSLAARRANGFPLRGTYVFRVPAAETWHSIDVKGLARAAMRHLKLSWRIMNFVTRRTTVVQTNTQKLDSIFCNFRELAARTSAPPCMCHTASPDLPKNEEGHVCARTTDLGSTVLAPLQHSLKATPAFNVDCRGAAWEACLDYVDVFAGFTTRCEDEKVADLLPLQFEEEKCSYFALRVSEHKMTAAKVKGVITAVETWPVWFTVMRGALHPQGPAAQEGVFKFLAPQSALGYEDRSTGTRFNVIVLLIQNAAARRLHPVTDGSLARLERHFRGRLTIEPRYSEKWVAPYCAGRASLNQESWEVAPLSGELKLAARRMKRKYFQLLLVKERETSAAQFERVNGTAGEVMDALRRQYFQKILQTVARFDTNGYFGTLYVLIKDKVFGATFDVKNQFSNVDHCLAARAVTATIDSPSMAGLVCAYGEREFSESLRADAYFINLMSFVRQADDCMVLIIFITGSSREWNHIRGILRGYRDDCYIDGMRVLQTGAACADLCSARTLEFCGMEVSFTPRQCGLRPLTHHEKRDALAPSVTLRAYPFVHWKSMCTRTRKFITLIGALHRVYTQSSHDVLRLIALTKIEMELYRVGYPPSWLRDGILTVAGSTGLDFWVDTAARVRQQRDARPTSLFFN